MVKVHMRGVLRPYCRPQNTHYQPHQVTDNWPAVTCLRCLAKKNKSGSYAQRNVV